MDERTFHVTGMTCDHCVRAVRSHVSALDGVHAVEVELASGTLRVQCEERVEPEAILEAVREAGYDGALAN